MILEAFSQELQADKNRGRAPERVLFDWLVGHLLVPAHPHDHVSRVIQTEIALLDVDGRLGFEGRSASGHTLLQSLFNYCRSYEQWQFSRWLHHMRASDFPLG